MKKPIALTLFLGLALAAGSVRAQLWQRSPERGQFPVGPPRGPAPARAQARPAPPPPAPRRPQEWQGRVAPPPVTAARPHVDRDARWLGHESGPRDVHYRLEHPWRHGRFRQPIGPGHVYRFTGWVAPGRRFWFARSMFVVADFDWPYVSDWDWNNDQIVLYNDPDHPGWYLAYNVRVGSYVHVRYDGVM